MRDPRALRHQIFPVMFLIGIGLWLLSLAAGTLLHALETSPWQAYAQSSGANGSYGVVLEINGPIGPALSDYFITELDKANAAGASVVIIEMDTPGGLDTSMRDIIQAILGSDAPVVTWVGPSGARAASAGLYILVASHVAAMAPGTNTGAATPIEIGGVPSPPKSPLPEADSEKEDESSDEADTASEEDDTSDTDKTPALGNEDALRAKVINDATAYIKSLAEMRGRNVIWVERAVRAAESLPAQEALELNVIDIVARDMSDLLAQLDGREVTLESGEKETLTTDGLVLERHAPGWLTRFLAFISNPNVAFIFMSLGTTGIIIEMWNPGAIFPGTLGVVSLIIGLYSFQVLPVNWAGAALIAIGIVLVVAEAYTPSLGLLGGFGFLLFIAGSLLLFPSDTPGFTLSRTLIFSVAGIIAAFLAVILYAVAETRHRGAVVGAEALQGRVCVVAEWEGGHGWVFMDGERWKARSDEPRNEGETVHVKEVDGLVLFV